VRREAGAHDRNEQNPRAAALRAPPGAARGQAQSASHQGNRASRPRVVPRGAARACSRSRVEEGSDLALCDRMRELLPPSVVLA
jgi:hypothetical protein